MRDLNLYRFDYEGVYLGGVAIVAAPSEEEARCALLQMNASAKRLSQRVIDNATVQLIEMPSSTAVLYNYDGDY